MVGASLGASLAPSLSACCCCVGTPRGWELQRRRRCCVHASGPVSHVITSSIICHDSLPYYANNTHANNTCADNPLHVRKGGPRTQAPTQRCIVSNKVRPDISMTYQRPDISMPPHTKRQPSSSAVIVCPHRRTRVCTHTHDPSVGHAARAHSLTLALSYPPSLLPSLSYSNVPQMQRIGNNKGIAKALLCGQCASIHSASDSASQASDGKARATRM